MDSAQYPEPMNRSFARAVSLFGHPMLVLPLAVVALAAARGQYRAALWLAAGFAIFAAVVMGYSAWQVRRGRWSHVDASDTRERHTLNRFLLITLVAATVLSPLLWNSHELTLGLGLCAAMVATAMLTARWWKLSLHMAFVVFSACLLLLGTNAWIGGVALVFAALVAWSRLTLQRHVPRDLVAGISTGALAGVLFAVFDTTGIA